MYCRLTSVWWPVCFDKLQTALYPQSSFNIKRQNGYCRLTAVLGWNSRINSTRVCPQLCSITKQLCSIVYMANSTLYILHGTLCSLHSALLTCNVVIAGGEDGAAAGEGRHRQLPLAGQLLLHTPVTLANVCLVWKQHLMNMWNICMKISLSDQVKA